jgi:UDPglucose 6-dehydrogenase
LLKEVSKPARVTILGLTYKEGTDTLRRSESLRLGQWLVEQGAEVVFHDPRVAHLPEGLAGKFHLTNNLVDALKESDLLVVATSWPIYREEVVSKLLKKTMRRVAVIDQNRFLAEGLEGAPGIMYFAVGKPLESD